ncbi:MAG: putative cytidylate kinase [Candidatus Kaiserbacteria bacterium]|nr:putative cytidylate kinase [Candidatus Kaiserbacteria bacterium]
MKKSIITVAGSLGSGKSSTAKAVAKALGFRHFSSGDLFRSIATKRNLSVEALNLTAEDQQEIDHEVDELLKSMYETESGIVIDSRMAWHWMPDSFKIYLTLDPQTAATRIFSHIHDEGRIGEHAASVEDVLASISRRFASEQKRYADLYQVDVTNPLNFDMVINTKQNDLISVTNMLLASYNVWQSA